MFLNKSFKKTTKFQSLPAVIFFCSLSLSLAGGRDCVFFLLLFLPSNTMQRCPSTFSVTLVLEICFLLLLWLWLLLFVCLFIPSFPRKSSLKSCKPWNKLTSYSWITTFKLDEARQDLKIRQKTKALMREGEIMWVDGFRKSIYHRLTTM